jgi:uncharacterized peroxidase-related enzyme
VSNTFRISLPLRQTGDADPNVSTPLLEAQKKMGMVPNMYRAMANLPALLDAYQNGYQQIREKSGFSAIEQEVLFLSISRENGCEYCVAAHSFIADAMSKVPPAVTDAIREGTPISDPKLEALRSFTRKMVASRGNPTTEDAEAFLNAGYSEEQILGVIFAIGVKILSNYTNHLFRTEVDPAFAGRSWSEASSELAA